MHSKERLHHYQGNSGVHFQPGTLNQTIIEALYGRYREIDGKSKQEWLLSVQQGTLLESVSRFFLSALFESLEQRHLSTRENQVQILEHGRPVTLIDLLSPS